MGKSSGKKKKQVADSPVNAIFKHPKSSDNSPTTYDNDTSIFIVLSQELKEEGNKLFQKRDCEGALLKYEKALKLLPRNHIDVAYLRSNMAACYMQMGISDYPRAVHECNLALEVSPKYSKALIKRARCYEGLNRLELAFRDLNSVLAVEPNNLTALELIERVKQAHHIRSDQGIHHPVPEYIESPPHASVSDKTVNNKTKKKKATKSQHKKEEDSLEKQEKDKDSHVDETVEAPKDNKGKEMDDTTKKQANLKANVEHGVEYKGKKRTETNVEHRILMEIDDQVDKQADDKLVVEDKTTISNGDVSKKIVKLVFGDDIRWAQLPKNCGVLTLREIVQERFQTSTSVLVKYKDEEGDMITITTDEELRWAEAAAEPRGSVKLYIVEVKPESDPLYEKLSGEDTFAEERNISENGSVSKKQKDERPLRIEEWIIEFAQLFKNYVGFSSDAYLDLHEIGVKLYTEAMEDITSGDEAHILFDMAAEKFQDMTALALFNWGNVHMARARKRIHFHEGSSEENMIAQVETAYKWAQQEYEKAGQKYEEAVKIKPNFFEGHLALAQQQFDQAKLDWCYVVANNVDLDTWSSAEVVDLYNNAETNIEKGMNIWEELEEHYRNGFPGPNNVHVQMQKMGLERFYMDITADETAEQAMTVKSQINVLWGSMLYERSVMEFKLGLPVWHESLEVAVEKFENAGASSTDITVMIKNHCSNDTAVEGVGFRIDEIVQAWNEMDDAKRWYTRDPSFRLEPLLRRRVPKIYSALGHA